MKDIAAQLEAIGRSVTGPKVADGPPPAGEVVAVVVERTYDAGIDDVWEALTDPERLPRWFLPISGDLRVGGTFQLEGNAGGDILVCEPPATLRVTFGGPESIVELRLTATADGRTDLVLEHTVPVEMTGGGAGALYVGPGWDEAFVALARHVAGEVFEPSAADFSPEAQQLGLGSIERWEAAVALSGTASPEDTVAAVAVARAQYAPDVT